MTKTNKSFTICISALAVIWIVGCLVFADFEIAGFYYWGGFVGGLITLLAVLLVTTLCPPKGNRATTEIGFMPVIFGGIYLLISLGINSKFLLMMTGGVFNKVLVILNVICLAAYLLAVYFANQYAARVVAQSDALLSKTANGVNLGVQLASLLSVVKDPDVKQKLHKLKEKLDYSPNTSQNFTNELEADFSNALQDIRNMLDTASKEEILEKIDQAERIWNDRNAKIASVR